jgi:hypothetical protein
LLIVGKEQEQQDNIDQSAFYLCALDLTTMETKALITVEVPDYLVDHSTFVRVSVSSELSLEQENSHKQITDLVVLIQTDNLPSIIANFSIIGSFDSVTENIAEKKSGELIELKNRTILPTDQTGFRTFIIMHFDSKPHILQTNADFAMIEE